MSSGSWFGTSLKSIFAIAFDGNTVFPPGPVYPEISPHMLHVGEYRCLLSASWPSSPRSSCFSPRFSFSFCVSNSIFDMCSNSSFDGGFTCS